MRAHPGYYEIETMEFPPKTDDVQRSPLKSFRAGMGFDFPFNFLDMSSLTDKYVKVVLKILNFKF